jgi:hypothetical protein
MTYYPKNHSGLATHNVLYYIILLLWLMHLSFFLLFSLPLFLVFLNSCAVKVAVSSCGW